MDVPREVTEFWKIWLSLGALFLALAWTRLPGRWGPRLLHGGLLLAALNYTRYGTESLTTRVDAYDLLHYYVNAKYFDELGYYDLYPAMLFVDRQNDGPFFNEREKQRYMAQDDAGHHFESVDRGVVRGAHVRGNFTPARWAQFEHDILYLQRTVGCSKRDRKGNCTRELTDAIWNELINDHGFNGTPGWLALARPFTIVPVEWVKLLGYLDLALVGGAVGMVSWAYGGTAASFTALFLLVSYSTRWPTVPWVFLRYDWIALLLAATALLKRGKPLLAGVAAGIATASRLFPALWMWGPFTRGVSELAERRWHQNGLVRRTGHRPALLLAGGFLIGALAVEGLAVARFGREPVAVHLENMMDHNSAEQLSSRRIGLALALATEPWRGTATERRITDERRDTIKQQEPIRYGLAAVGLLALGWALRRRSDDEAFGYGFLPFFWITTASYYYYVARSTLIVLHASDLSSLRNRVGLAFLFGLEAFSSAAEGYTEGHRMFLIGTLAWGLALYGVVAVVWLAREQRTAS